VKKPPFISHYLVLQDLINGIDVRIYNDSIVYLVSRIENIKVWLKKQGIEFIEDAVSPSRFANYKPYILINTSENMKRAEELLENLETQQILDFIEFWKSEDEQKTS